MSALDLQGLYQAHARDVRRFALFLSGDPALADDLVSETFVRLWHARERVDLATVRAYLFAIARNLYLRSRARERGGVGLDERLTDPAPGPERAARARDELAGVIAALQTLPEIDRAALLMRADGDVPYEEIAAALGITPGAARVKVHRARLKLASARSGGAGPMIRNEEPER